MEAEMRVITATLVGWVVLAAAVPVQTAAFSPAKAIPAELGADPRTELVRDGCGYAYYRTQWQDGWGLWHWGRCVPKWWGRGAFQEHG